MSDRSLTEAVAPAPSRRGPKKREFTRTQEQILRLIAGETAVHGGICCTKQELADRLNRNEKTVSRLIKGLRERGYIEAQMRYGADGGQLPSLYRTVAPGPRSGKGQA